MSGQPGYGVQDSVVVSVFDRNATVRLSYPVPRPMALPLQILRHPLASSSAAAAAAALLGLAACAIFRRRTTPAEREQRRRSHLAATGRIVDGSLTGAEPDEDIPNVILYKYRIAGVTYECSQDISAVTPPVRNLSLNFPVQVRYDRDNPGDSIVVAEDWNGLWSTGMRREPGMVLQVPGTQSPAQ